MSHRQLCYLDNNATTRIAPEVLDAMLPFFQHQWGNPSSAYIFGKQVAGHIEKAREKLTAIVSIMWANNETGVLFPIEEIAAICRSKGVPFHTDAVQTPGKLKIDVKSTGVDFLSLSAHKLHAPKGIGLLYVKRHTKFSPYVIGGGQERGRRGGTENVPYIVGFGRAAELAIDSLNDENTRVRALRDRLETNILRAIPNTMRTGSR